MAIAKQICPDFELEAEQKLIVNDIFRWCMRLPGKLDLNKGLWIWGDIGSGKSTLMEIVERFLHYRVSLSADPDFMPLKWIAIIPADEICELYERKGAEGLEKIRDIQRLCIDDAGTEQRFTSHFGNPINVIGRLLMYRSRLTHRNRNVITFVTTNLRPEQIAENYDDRVFDRSGEMFNLVEFGGYTHRPAVM